MERRVRSMVTDMNPRLAILTAVALLDWSAARAQPPKFEAVSIRRCDDAGSGPASSPGRLNLCRRLASEMGPPPQAPVEGLIEDAYGRFAGGRVNPPWAIPKVEGGPAWIWNDPYAIAATAPGSVAGGPVTEAMMRGPMMQAVLEDRFNLKLHRVTREAPVYQLVVAKGGSKLRRFQEGSAFRWDPAETLQGPGPAPPRGKWCESGITGLGTIRVFGRGITIQAAVYLLSLNLDRPVVDKTGLTGWYDFEIEFARDPSLAGPPPPPPSPGTLTAETRDQPSGSSIFTAVEQQLGLRLESAKGPRDFLIVDQIERPSQN